jgi:hypothetical protein
VHGSGYPGIGGWSVANELRKVLVLPRGRFASSKFDQYKRVPHCILAGSRSKIGLYFHIDYRPSHHVIVPPHRVNASSLQVEDRSAR